MVSETRATQPSGRNVLEDLDSRIPTGFYWYLAVLACVGGFLFGYDTSNIGSALSFIPYHLSSFWTGYLVAGASLGAGAGALIAGPLTDHFGRKTLLMTDAGIYAIGALLSAFALNAFMLLSARTLIGLAIGADSAIATSYIAEFAPRDRRGQLSIIQQWMITVGILVSYLVAVVILVALPHSAGSLDWRLILGIGALPAILAVALRSKMPESPRWLMLHDRYADTRKAFGQLGMETTEEEIRAAAEQLRGTVEERQRKTQWTKGVIRALIVVCVFFIFQQITGINVPLYYGPHLLGPIFSGAHATLVQTTIAGVEVTAIMTAVNVAATYLGFRWIDKYGRKVLSIGGYTGMIVFALVTALGLAATSGTLRLVVIMIGLDFFIASFAVGVGGVGWTLQGEVFPTAVRGQAAAFAAMIDWLANFALIEVFPVTQNAISLAGVMVVFASLCALAIVFIWKFLPETKNLPVEEIVQVFERQQKESVLGKAA